MRVIIIGTCTNTNKDFKDSYGDDCNGYAQNKYWCGKYDTNDFKSKKMCCGCGGGKFVAGINK